MRKNFVMRMLYTDVYWDFYFHVFIHILFHVCLCVIVLSLRSDSDYNKEATYLLTYLLSTAKRTTFSFRITLADVNSFSNSFITVFIDELQRKWSKTYNIPLN